MLIAKYCNLKKFVIFLATLWFCFGVCIFPTVAKIESSTNLSERQAAIVLDGRKLFEIRNSGDFTAIQRAEKINSLLQDKLKQYAHTRQPIDVEVATQSDWTVIRVNDRHLLTIAENDLIPGMSAREQADIWREQIESAIERGIQERSPESRKWVFKIMAIALTVVAVIQFGLFCLKRRYNRKKLEATAAKWVSWAILSILATQALIWAIFVNFTASLFPITRTWQYYWWNGVDRALNSEIFDFGGDSLISLRKILILLLLCIVWWLFVRWFSRSIESNILPLTGLENTLQSSIAFLTYYGLLFLGLILILNGGNVDFRSLTVAIGALGVGIGFGLQNIAKDFVSGLILTLTRPIKIGELVEVGEYKGLVLRIGARTTEISHVDRYIMTVPNSRFIEETIKNWHRSGLTRVKVYVDVASDSDRDLVYKALLAAAQVYHPDILKHPPPKARFRQFDRGSLLFRVVVFIKDPLKEPKVRNHIQKHIDINLNKYGIKIPFHQREINFKIPQLDELVANLARVYAPVQPQLYYPQKEAPFGDRKPQLSLEELTIHDEFDWESLVAAMRGEHGINIQDRRYGLKTYSKVFLGSEAVSWLIQQEKATRSEAIAIGQMMLEQNIIHHVLDEHDFKDEPLFYRFYLDEAPT